MAGEPMEAGDEQVVGVLVQQLRRRHLLEHALLHHRDTIPHGHGLDLVVGDVHGRDAEILLELEDLGAHLRGAWRPGSTGGSSIRKACG